MALPEVRTAQLPAWEQGPLPARGSPRMGGRPERVGFLGVDVGRPPLPIGSWGLIRTYPIGEDSNGKPLRHRALARYRDFDGVTRLVQASGRTGTQASQALRMQLQGRALAGRHGELTGMTKFCDAADLWLSRLDERVAEGRRSPGTVETYRRQLKNHILPAMGEVRLGEATTPLVDKVIGAVKRKWAPRRPRAVAASSRV